MRLTQARDEYLNSRRSQGYAAGTIRNNRKDLNKLIRTTGDIDTRKLTAQHIDRTFAEAATNNGPGSLGNYHATLTAFFRWCRSRGYMKPDQDPMAGRRAPKHITKPRTLVPVTQFTQLLNAAEARDKRDRAVIALGLYTMLRQSEIRSLRVKDLNLDTGQLNVYLHKIKKHDTLPVSAELDLEMRIWLTHYTVRVGEPLNPDWFLVPARTRKQWGREAPQTLNPTSPISNMHYIAQAALTAVGMPLLNDDGDPTREGMHTLRRSAARALFDTLSEQGYDQAMRAVQTFLNHSTLAQTEAYLQVDPDRKTRNDKFTGHHMFPNGDSTIIDLNRYRDGHG